MIQRNRTCPPFLSALLFCLAVLLTGCSSSHPHAGVITISSGNGALTAGTTMQLRAVDTNVVGTPTDVTSSATWTSSNTTVATVSSTGLMTGLSAGSSTITATYSSDSGSLTVTIGSPLISSIALTPAGVSVPAGQTQQYTATAAYANNTTANISSTSQWSVAPASVATISATGLLTAVAPGTYTVTASAGAQPNTESATIAGTVVAPVLSSIAITPATPSIAGGAQQQFKATGTYSNQTTGDLSSSVAWTSSNTTLLNVNSAGLATAAPSSTTSTVQLTATSGAVNASIPVTITPGAYVTSLVITPTSSSIAMGTAEQHKATAWYSDGTRRDVTAAVTWTSTDSNVATVNASGANTAVTPGVATLQASLPIAANSSTTEKATAKDANTVQASSVVIVTAATPTALNIVSSHPLFPVGSTQPVQLIGTFSDGTTQDLSLTANWQTSDANIATINSAGLATGVAAGPVVFSASFGGLTASTQGFQITSTGLVSTTINAPYPAPTTGTCQQLKLVGTYADGTTHDLTALASWITTDASVMTVDASGYACAVPFNSTKLTSKTAQVTATVAAHTSSITLATVNNSAVSVSIYPQPAKFALGTTLSLTGLVTLQNGVTLDLTPNAIWSSANPNIITVDATGRAKSGKAGTTVVTAAVLGVTGTSTPIQITNANVTRLMLLPAPSTIAAGTGQPYKVIGYFSDGTTQNLNRDVTWSSSDSATASIDATGLALGVKPGQVQIAATFNGQTATVPLSVSNATLLSTTLTPSNTELPLGTKRTFVLTGNFTDGTAQDLSYDTIFSTPTPSVIGFLGVGQAVGASTGIGQITAQRGYFNSSTPVTVPNVSVSSIAVSPADNTVRLSSNALITATGTFSDGFSMNLVDNAAFNSSAPQVATVLQSGRALAVGLGDTTISASFQGVSASTNSFHVLSNALSSISLSPTNPSVLAGNTLQLTATGTYADGTTSDVSSSVIWTSSNPALLTISSTGVATAFSTASPATSTVTATFGGASTSFSVTVLPAGSGSGAVLSSITITPTSSRIAAGGTQQLTATGLYADGTSKDLTSTAVWTSTQPSTAIVNNLGLVTAVSPGLVSIQASIGSIRSSSIVTVTAAALQSIVITPSSAGLTSGGSQQFTASGIYTNQSTSDITSSVTWSSSNSALLTITAAGLATVPAAAPSGSVTVTAQSGSISSTANVQVSSSTTVTNLVVTPTSSSIAAGSAEQHSAIATYSDGTQRDVTNEVAWSTSSTSTPSSNIIRAHAANPRDTANTVITVNQSGIDTAMSPGTTQVRATLNGMLSQSVVIVTPATVTSITITSNKSLFPVGAQQPLTLIGRFSDGTTQDLTLTANWQSLNPSIATVDAQGNATGVKAGTVDFNASFGGLSTTSRDFTILPATLLYGTLNTFNSTNTKGTSVPYNFIGTYSDGSTYDLTSLATWSSSNPAVLTIDGNGNSFSVGAGTSEVTGTVFGRSATATHAVLDTSIVSISVRPSSPSFALGTTNDFDATATFANGVQKNVDIAGVVFTSSDPSVFTIDVNGVAKAGKVGSATVTASMLGIQGVSIPVQVTAATLWRMSVTPNQAKIGAQTTLQYKAIGFFSDGSVQDITKDLIWTTDDPSIARIDSNGLVFSVAPGATHVAGTMGSQSFRYPLTVTTAKLLDTNIIPLNSELPIGINRQFSLIGSYSDGTTQDLTQQAVWSTSTPGITSITGHGLVIGAGIGTGSVSAQFGFYSDSTPVTVTNVSLTGLILSPANSTLRVGDQQQMIATGTFSDGLTQDLTLETNLISSAPTVAAILTDEDIAYATAIGTTRVDATFRNITASTTSFRVLSNVITSIDIEPVHPSLEAGDQEQFTAVATYSDGSTADITKGVTWTSSNPAVLNLDSNGLATAFSTPGPVTVIVTASDGGVTDTFSMNVLPDGSAVSLDSIAITPEGGSIAAGRTRQLTATAWYSDGSVKDLTNSVTWTTSDATLLTVNASGLATSPDHNAGGPVTVTAKSGTISISTSIQITTTASITQIVVEPTSSSIATGTAEQHLATAWYSDGTQRDVSATVTWSTGSSSNSSSLRANARSVSAHDASSNGIVTVDQTGFTTAGTPGQAMLQASLGSVQSNNSVVIVTPATVTSLSIRSSHSYFPAGATQKLQLIGAFSDGSSQDLSLTANWQTSSSAIATISSTGTATGVSAGGITFTASFDGLTASTVGFQVLPSNLVSLTVDSDYSTVSIGREEQFHLIGTYNDGSNHGLSPLTTWQSSNPDVFSVDVNTGVGYGLAPGTVQITGILGDRTATKTISVLATTIVSIQVVPNTQTIAHGTTHQFTAIATFANGNSVDITGPAVWVSNDPNVLTISGAGLAKSGDAGSTQVTATLLGTTGTSGAITVTPATLSKLTIQAPSSTLGPKVQQQFTATGTFSDGTFQDITRDVMWNTADNTIASVDAAGVGMGLKAGQTQVTATFGGQTASSPLTISNAVLTSVSLTPGNAELPVGIVRQYTLIGTFSDGTTQDLTANSIWSPGQSSNVSVFLKGHVLGVSIGTGVVTAQYGYFSASTPVNVTNATLTSLALSPTSAAIRKGAIQNFTVTGTFSDGLTMDMALDAQFQTSTSGIASILRYGQVGGVSPGSAQISTNFRGQTATTTSFIVLSDLVTSISLSPASPTVTAGTSQQLTATALYTDGTSSDITTSVTWTSSNPALLTVSSKGIATAVAGGSGSATVTATSGGTTASFVVTVQPAQSGAPTLTSLTVTPTSSRIAMNTTQQLTATGVYSDGTIRNLTSSVAWTSSTPSSATVNATGLVGGIGPGQVTIQASFGSATGSAVVLITSATLNSIAISPSGASFAAGFNQQFTLTGTFSDGTTQNLSSGATWSSSNGAVASISASGLAVGLAPGSVQFSATYAGRTVTSSTATVTPANLVSISVSPANASFAKGTSQQFTVTGTFTDGTTRDLTTSAAFTSSNPGVIAISTSGVASGIGPGTAQITISVGNQTITTQPVTITAATLVSVAINPMSPSLANGTSQQFTAVGTFSDGTTEILTSQAVWTSSNPQVITIDQFGDASTTSVGSAQISATVNGVTVSTGIVQVTPASIASLTITPTSAQIAKGTTQQFSVIGTFTDGTTQNLSGQVTWTSSDGTVVGVDANGLATGTGTGSAQITASYNGKSISTTPIQVTPATLLSIAFNPANPTVAAGTTGQVAVIGTFSDDTTQDLTGSATFSSSNTAVATISGGVVTGVGTGNAIITVTANGQSGSFQVSVSSAILSSIAITPANPAPFAKGTTQQFSATGTFSDGTTQNLTSTVNWTSSNTSVFTVDQNGLATGTGVGTANLSASSQGQTVVTSSVQVTPPTIASLSVTPTSVSIASGATQQFSAIATYTDSSTQDASNSVTWTSSNTGVATVSSTGLATGSATGNATIQAVLGSLAAQATVSVSAPVMQSISITPSTPSIVSGSTQQFTATALFTNGTTQNVTSQVTWQSTSTSTATINNSGLATATGSGATTIKASLGAFSASTSLTVTAAPLQSITITPASPSIVRGTTQQFAATGTYSDGTTQNLTSQVTWTSSNSAFATVNSLGVASGLASGTTTIQAQTQSQNGPVSGTTTLTILPPPVTLQSIAITPASATVTKGATQQFTATGTYSDNSTQDLTTQVTWSSSSTNATINPAGVATGVLTGIAQIQASISGKTATANLTIHPAILNSIAITPASVTIADGTTQQYVAIGTYSDGSTQTLTTQVTWTSSNTSLASIASTGLATGVATGAASITATSGTVTSNTAALTITAATATSIQITPSPITNLPAGDMQQLLLTATFTDGSSQNVTSSVTYSVSNPAIAIVNAAGLLNAVAPGSAVVTATLGSLSTTVPVTVANAVLSSIAITPANPSLAAGLTQQLTATGTYTDGSTQNLTNVATWSSSNATTTSVSSSGVVTVVSAGVVTITATYSGISGTDNVTGTAATVTAISVTPANATLAAGQTQQFTATGTFTDGSQQNITSAVHWSVSDATKATIGGTTGLLTSTAAGNTNAIATMGSITGSASVTITAATLNSLTINPQLLTSIAAGTTRQLSVTGAYSDGSNADVTALVTWSTGSASTAYVDNTGLLHAVASGLTTIDAHLQGVDGTAIVSVSTATLTSIAITPANPTLALGQTVQLTATGTYSDGSTQDITSQVQWNSSASTVATVSSTGLLISLRTGGSTLSATRTGVTGQTTLTITSATLQSIAVQAPQNSFALGQNLQLQAIGTYSDGTTQILTSSVMWTSGTATVGVVNSAGLATGVRAGTFNAVATLGSVSGSLPLTVTAATLVSIAITPANQVLLNIAGSNVQFTATGTFSDGSTQNLTTSVHWATTGIVVGTITQAGVFSPTGIGAGTITATSGTISTATGVVVVSLLGH